MFLARDAYFNVFSVSSKLLSAGEQHAIILMLYILSNEYSYLVRLLPPSES